VGALLRAKQASNMAIEKAVRAYREMADAGVTDFTYKVSDEGHTFAITVTMATETTR
jgi:hypothetical protein